MGCMFWGKAVRATALSFVLAGAARAEGPQYHLGQGLDVGDFNIAGYANVVGDLPTGGERRALSLDDLSLYVSGHVNRIVNPFMETELTSYTILHSGGAALGDVRGHVVLERLYNDSMLTDSMTLRLGKMLTAVGEWNQIHAAPLVWTTTRPLSTFKSFSEYTTGASVLYSDPSSVLPEMQFYWQPGKEIGPKPRSLVDRQYYGIAGVHADWPIGLTDKIGLSFQRSRVVGDNAAQYLTGVNARYSFDRFMVDGEATYTRISGYEPGAVRSTEWGGYVLGSYALTEKWSLMSWYEVFQERTATAPVQDVLAGIAYRPVPALVWKAEYVQNVAGSVVNARTGAYLSFSVLF